GVNARIGDTVVFKTRWGWMGAAASAQGVRAIVLPKASRRAVEAALQGESLSSNGRPSLRPATVLREARAQLEGFLEGTRRELDFPVDLSGGTAFQRRVWRTILWIPYGRVRPYKWVAVRVGGRQYARAVGLALGANPVPIMVPCHRVVARDASLGGFSGGLRTKRRLLQLEGTLSALKS
ncbi:MAG: methylated-DNA--[protein]-cysteine S-methyltransferase, partial [Nitrospiraceae bacterium]